MIQRVIALVSISLLIMLSIFNFTTENAKADPITGTVFAPIPMVGVNSLVGATSSSGVYASTLDNVNQNFNPAWVTDSDHQKLFAGSFTDFANYGDQPVTDILSGNYFDTYGNIAPPSTANVGNAYVILRSNGYPWSLNEGWFSIYWQNVSILAAYPFYSTSGFVDTYSSTLNKNNTAPNLINSTTIPYLDETSDDDEGNQALAYQQMDYWEITSYVNISILTSPYFTAVWNHGRNITGNKIDYFGIYYSFTTGGSLPEDIESSTETSIFGMLWLFIIFFPAIAMAQYIPKWGYAVGMILMLTIFGFAENGFYAVTLIGYLAIGMLFYKGG